MNRGFISLCIGLVGSAAIGANPPPSPAPPQPSNGPSAIQAPVSALQPLPRFDQRCTSPGVWERIQPDLDRSLGWLADPQTYELDRLELQRIADQPGASPHAQFELFQFERDRELRLEDLQERLHRAQARSAAQRREDEMRRREYQIWLNHGLSSAMGAQAEQDELALSAARQRRDAAVEAAKKSGTLERDRQAIQQQYQQERARILGMEPAAEK